tara:strand:- start:101 stop:802 length:702 start_codon:yes stop_codon:yes gene_type:complete
MISFLFDIDGTLTPARKRMEKDFKTFFGLWTGEQYSKGNKVFLVTGSDKDKTKRQIGVALWRFVTGCYQNCGNQLYVRGRLREESSWKPSDKLRSDIAKVVESSMWYCRAKNNLEERTGMANMSTVGRSASPALRKEYFEWDKRHREREKIVQILSSKHPELEFAIGGEISIDIYPKGKDKSQVLSDMFGHTVFFGDRCGTDGNDYHISQKADKYYHVKDPNETRQILETIYG